MNDVFFQFNSGSVTASVKNGKKKLLEDVGFTLCKGEKLALIGETGSGKTMTALEIMDLLPVNVRAEGRRFSLSLPEGDGSPVLGKDIVYIPQNGADYLNPVRKIGKQLADSIKLADPEKKFTREELRGEAAKMLGLAGLENGRDYLGRYPFQLSGGQNQRVTIALAACAEPMLLIADEPTNGLDEDARDAFLKTLDELFPEAAKIIITHDIGVAEACGKIAVLRGGRVMEAGAAREILSNPKSDYTKALMDARVESGMKYAY